MMDLLTCEENKLYSKLQHEILDDTNFTTGSIFDDIIKINDEMSKRLQARIDLRTEDLLPPDGNA